MCRIFESPLITHLWQPVFLATIILTSPQPNYNHIVFLVAAQYDPMNLIRSSDPQETYEQF